MKFATAINCMDGRVQLPVIKYLLNRFSVDHVDMITEPGPIAILSLHNPSVIVDNILNRIDVSVQKHHSVGLALVGHHDCAGNPVGKEDQVKQLKAAHQLLSRNYPKIHMILLWVNEDWEVEEIPVC
jgi:hypothetical protein